MKSAIAGLEPGHYRPHRLHDPERRWPQTNCYVDLMIEVMHATGHDPVAALGFTVAQDFEGDQFTFFKFPTADLQLLVGLDIQELAVFDRLETHVLTQIERGRLPLVEVDAFYLPDTKGDYDGIFGQWSDVPAGGLPLFPYAEFVKFDVTQPARDRAAAALGLLVHHLRRRPKRNPIAAYAAAFERHAEALAHRSPEYFHTYAFNTLRQVGANFELLGTHLNWLDSQRGLFLAEAEAAANTIAEGAKVMQFRLARAMARQRFDGMAEAIAPMAQAWDSLMAMLDEHLASASSKAA